MRYFSMFSGIGGFELGIQRAALSVWDGQTENTESGTSKPSMESTTEGLQSDRDSPNTKLRGNTGSVSCVGYSEIDKYAIKVYERNFHGHKNYGDATRINTAELPDFDLLVGGFPCQAFSVAGKRAGFDDTRGTLIFDVVRILRDKRPRYFVLENVKGLLSHDGGKTFSHILEILTDSGYDVSWSVHNSKNYGVPQNRERIYFIGSLRRERRPQVFPITDIDRQTLRQVVGGSQGNRVYDTDGVSSTIASQSGGLGPNTGLYAIPVLTPDRLEKRQNGRRFKEDGEPSFTLNTQDRHGIYDGAMIRRLTPTECERLQGFPDNWTMLGGTSAGEIMSDTQRYKMCGNAVTVNVVAAVMDGLLKHSL